MSPDIALSLEERGLKQTVFLPLFPRGERGLIQRVFIVFFMPLLLALYTATGHAQDAKLEIIPLRHRLVQEVLSVLQPLVAPGGSLSGMNNQLIVRTTESNLAEIKEVLAQIDQAARRLKIYVRQDVAGSGQVGEQSWSGRVGSSDVYAEVPGRRDRDGIGVSAGDGNNELRYRSYNTEGRGDERNLHFVQAVEGQPAFISTGQSIPVPNQSITYGPHGTYVTEGIHYRDLNTGFYVVPRVNGEQVTLAISPQHERLAPGGGGSIDTQSVDTTVTGRLGEWIDLGGVNEDYRDESNVNLTRTRRYGTVARGVFVRVEEIR
jgi:hypothetical protein